MICSASMQASCFLDIILTSFFNKNFFKKNLYTWKHFFVSQLSLDLFTTVTYNHKFFIIHIVSCKGISNCSNKNLKISNVSMNRFGGKLRSCWHTLFFLYHMLIRSSLKIITQTLRFFIYYIVRMYIVVQWLEMTLPDWPTFGPSGRCVRMSFPARAPANRAPVALTSFFYTASSKYLCDNDTN